MLFVMILLVVYTVALAGFSRWAFTAGKKQGILEGTRETNAHWHEKARQKQLEIKCLCGHGPNMHQAENGPCDQTVEWDMRGPGGVYEKRTKCRCKRYTGPEFLPTYIDKLELEMKKL